MATIDSYKLMKFLRKSLGGGTKFADEQPKILRYEKVSTPDPIALGMAMLGYEHGTAVELDRAVPISCCPFGIADMADIPRYPVVGVARTRTEAELLLSAAAGTACQVTYERGRWHLDGGLTWCIREQWDALAKAAAAS